MISPPLPAAESGNGRSSALCDGSLIVGGLRLSYGDWGGPDDPIVLLHGLASTRHIWDLVAPILSPGYRVVALDQRGHGESGKPDCGYGFQSIVADLRGFIAAMGLDRPLVVGHSWGAGVALELAAAHPEVARGICLVDGGTMELQARPDMTLARAREEMAPPDFTGVTLDQMKARMSRFVSWATPEVRSAMLKNFEVLEDSTVRARLSRANHMRIIEAMWEQRPSQLFPRVRCPVLLMPARRRDDPSPSTWWLRRRESIAKAAALLPRSKTVWLEDSVHDVPLQRPALVAETISDHLSAGFFG